MGEESIRNCWYKNKTNKTNIKSYSPRKNRGRRDVERSSWTLPSSKFDIPTSANKNYRRVGRNKLNSIPFHSYFDGKFLGDSFILAWCVRDSRRKQSTFINNRIQNDASELCGNRFPSNLRINMCIDWRNVRLIRTNEPYDINYINFRRSVDNIEWRRSNRIQC